MIPLVSGYVQWKVRIVCEDFHHTYPFIYEQRTAQLLGN